MTAPKRPPANPRGFSEEQKIELAAIIASSLKTELSAAIRAELRDAGLRLDGDANQELAAKDFSFIRKMRIIFESASGKIGGAVVTAIVLGVASLLVYGAKAFLGK